MHSAVHYVHEVLDFKYKDSSKINDRYRDDVSVEEPRIISSDLLSFEAKQTNLNLIDIMQRTVDALKSNIERLKKDVLLESKIPEIEAEQLFLNWNHILKRHQEAWDGREKVLST